MQRWKHISITEKVCHIKRFYFCFAVVSCDFMKLFIINETQLVSSRNGIIARAKIKRLLQCYRCERLGKAEIK